MYVCMYVCMYVYIYMGCLVYAVNDAGFVIRCYHPLPAHSARPKITAFWEPGIFIFRDTLERGSTVTV